jgi:hypothetical protein
MTDNNPSADAVRLVDAVITTHIRHRELIDAHPDDAIPVSAIMDAAAAMNDARAALLTHSSTQQARIAELEAEVAAWEAGKDCTHFEEMFKRLNDPAVVEKINGELMQNMDSMRQTHDALIKKNAALTEKLGVARAGLEDIIIFSDDDDARFRAKTTLQRISKEG